MMKMSDLSLLLKSIGTKTSGTKALVVPRLERELEIPRLIIPRDGRPTRILSIDMGIKNLAYCVCDVSKRASADEKKMELDVEVKEWTRFGVLDWIANKSMLGINEGQTLDISRYDSGDLYGPPLLSLTALHLVRDKLWPHNPDTILIERQRFRSGGGSAVLEWTLRVNMFESMIWSVARTLSSSTTAKKPIMWPVSPKSVANFWLGGQVDAEIEKEHPRMAASGIEKKQKIELVDGWLRDDGNTVDADLSLSFVDGAAETKDAFLRSKMTPGGRSKSRPKSSNSSSSDVPTSSSNSSSKKDDLADCLLQAAAWCKWEQNRFALAEETRTFETEVSTATGSRKPSPGKGRGKGSPRKGKSAA
jgi:cruciform cutting endonuclease 1